MFVKKISLKLKLLFLQKKNLFLIKRVIKKPIPKHVAIIMDGNRRWIKKQFLFGENSFLGHKTGANVVIDISNFALSLGIKVITFFAFSTENWQRSKEEIENLFQIMTLFLKNKLSTMIDNGIRFEIIGDISLLPNHLQETLKNAITKTQHCSKIKCVIAINYGSRNEITRAFKKMYSAIESKKLNTSDISEDMVSSFLDTSSLGDPDLLIRTSGEMRISNFLLWQIAYTELYVTKTLWPDFKPKHLLKAIRSFQKRTRRTGR